MIDPADRRASSMPAEALRLKQVNIVDTRTGSITPGAEVVLKNGKIFSIRTGGADQDGPPLRTLDAGGRFLVPGYMDMHVHSMEQPRPEENLAALLAYGVTGIRNMAGSPELLRKYKEGLLDFGPMAPELLAMPGSLLTASNAATPEQGVDEVKAQAKQGADFIKTISVTPKTFFATLAEATRQQLPYGGHMSPGVDVVEASNRGLGFIEHLGGPFEMLLIKCSKAEFVIRTLMTLKPPKPVALSEAEMKSLTGQLIIANPILFRLTTEPKALEQSKRLMTSYKESKGRKLAAILARNRTWQCPTLIRSETMRFADLPRVAESPDAQYLPASTRATYTKFSRQYGALLNPAAREILEQHKQLAFHFVRMFEEAGVPMMTGSDFGGGWVIPGVSLHQEFDLLAEAGLSPLRILQMTTLDPARFLHREDSLGTVEEGKDANLVLLEGNPLERVENFHNLHAVIRRGHYMDRQQLAALRESVASRNAAA